MAIISVNNLFKTYRSAFKKNNIAALNGISFEVEEGEIFGFLGPNGAGKTTFIKILLGLVIPDSGNVSMIGKSIEDITVKEQIGYLPENHKFPGYFTAYQTLKYLGDLSNIPSHLLETRIKDLLKLVGLVGKENLKVKTFSKGMVQRLGIAQALVNDPKILFLDEPTDGVDPIGRKEIRDILLNLKQNGKTIFLNSHLLSEVEKISDRVAILNKGNLVKIGNMESVRSGASNYIIKVESMNGFGVEIFQGLIKDITNNSLSAQITNSTELNSIIDILREKKIIITEISPVQTSLEDSFINLIKTDEGRGEA